MPPPQRREEPDNTKPAADIHREYCYDYLYSPSVRGVTKIDVRTLVIIGIVG
jgi:hypothetical protein